MRDLTDKAKIHLACTVDDYTMMFSDSKEDFLLWDENNCQTKLKDYTPNDPESPYSMKYLGGIYRNLDLKFRVFISNLAGLEGILFSEENGADVVIEKILEHTGYTGEVWLNEGEK